jgi:hypothetical protein
VLNEGNVYLIGTRLARQKHQHAVNRLKLAANVHFKRKKRRSYEKVSSSAVCDWCIGCYICSARAGYGRWWSVVRQSADLIIHYLGVRERARVERFVLFLFVKTKERT